MFGLEFDLEMCDGANTKDVDSKEITSWQNSAAVVGGAVPLHVVFAGFAFAFGERFHTATQSVVDSNDHLHTGIGNELNESG